MLCRECRAEVRFGTRGGNPGWWHREEADHKTFPVPKPEEPEVKPLPAPEVPSRPVEPKDEAVPGGVRTITNLLRKRGWELRRLTHARGPYLGANGDVLSISDTVVLGAREKPRCPRGGLDRPPRIAVASWRDRKFDFAYVGHVTGNHITVEARVNATEMKSWIKGEKCPEPPAPTEDQTPTTGS